MLRINPVRGLTLTPEYTPSKYTTVFTRIIHYLRMQGYLRGKGKRSVILCDWNLDEEVIIEVVKISGCGNQLNWIIRKT